jgi:elongation factor G
MDKIGADFRNSKASIAKKFGDGGVAIQIPNGQAGDFQGVVDLITMKYYTFEGNMGITVIENEIPSHLVDQANEYREIMIDKVSMYSDELAEKFLM